LVQELEPAKALNDPFPPRYTRLPSVITDQLPPVVLQPSAFPSWKSSQKAQLPVLQMDGGVLEQLPLLQYGVLPLQARPQIPQLVVVIRLVSQPLSGFASQLLQPLSQVGVQSKLPGAPVQAVAPCKLEQVLPHAAQLEAVPSCVSQPFPVLQSA
jgi:hypothetical protein